jgi:hypothetical protein
MEFVIEILETIFHKQPAEAHRIMMMVHTQGKDSAAFIRSKSPRRRWRPSPTARGRAVFPCVRRWSPSSYQELFTCSAQLSKSS